ncbi:hypothetical protein [Microbacterium sp. MYb64]|uniref:hypothetical protein n=1 Tax=Microbacterium sp. MYb64 TaxID=1848691 RepID=UPI000CFC88EF|nr:hypothetical protein [Microbacterium sp. MYb64]PRB01728.1 hypothetical protein CQ044_16375 [Microbacterium sp. MYb64]
MTPERPAFGTEIVFQWRKWDGSPHWRHECVYLGADEWGDWVGQPGGWGSARPGRTFTAHGPNVTLVPPSGDYALTVNRDHPKGMRIYIDLAWDLRPVNPGGEPSDDLGHRIPGAVEDDESVPRPEGAPVLFTGIDMDLDVVRIEGERGTWIDDEDEWDEHRVQYGYPADVQRRLEALAADLEQRVRAQLPPFDDATADVWLDRLETLALPARAEHL